MNRLGSTDSDYALDAADDPREIPRMSNSNAGALHLRRIDPAQNMRRFYALAIQPTLFGGASLIRSWGRIGTNGQAMMETFDAPENADSAFERLARTKIRRGYRAAGVPKD